jgi:hypothetical protein
MIVVDTQLTCHDVVNEGVVRARVKVGPSQRSIWTMSLGVDPVAAGTEPQWIELGVGEQLRGNRLEVRTVLMDVEGSSEDLSCAVEVEGPGLTCVELRRPGSHGDIAAFVLAVLLQ